MDSKNEFSRDRCKPEKLSFFIFILFQLLTNVTCEAKLKVCLKLYRNQTKNIVCIKTLKLSTFNKTKFFSFNKIKFKPYSCATEGRLS